ncbi:hypothetical protein V6N11_029122 [Hibiscus sabdariffa]|uniref:Uncharacterized protein n=2 Tax=Hibiscus sabdariffa TaxID=183260 RepID=A0ABR2C386_9ROSI
MNKRHFHNSVFCFDFDQPHHGWKEAPHMLVPRTSPAVVAAKGKIYAFGGSALGQFAEVFDVSGSSWKLLSPPLDLDMDHARVSVTYPVLFDSPRSRILLNFGGHLYAYHVDDKSWECINENLGFPPSEAALVDNVLYYLVDEDLRGSYWFSDHRCSLKAYDVTFEYTKISLHNKSGEIHATGVSETASATTFGGEDENAGLEVVGELVFACFFLAAFALKVVLDLGAILKASLDLDVALDPLWTET